MKTYLSHSLIVFAFCLGACSTGTTTTAPETVEATAAAFSQSYGEKITPAGAIAATELPSLLANQDSAQAKVATSVLEVCQAKGCWMKVAAEGQEPIRVTFKNYGFFMPKDLTGKEVVFEGVAVRDTVSVEDQRHYAEDAGKSKEEIAAITQPKPSITFVASGVLVKD